MSLVEKAYEGMNTSAFRALTEQAAKSGLHPVTSTLLLMHKQMRTGLGVSPNGVCRRPLRNLSN